MEIFDMMCRSLTRDKFHDRSPNKGTELFHDKPEYEWALVREEIGTEEEDPIAEMYYLLHETAACVQTKMIAVQNSAVLARILYCLGADISAPCRRRT